MHKSPIFDLHRRVAPVTGASSGTSAHWSQILAKAGAKVVLAARRADRLEALEAAILAEDGEAIAVSMDVSDEASTIAAYDEAERHFDTVDTIVANASVNSKGSATDLDVAEFDSVVDVNVRGVFLTAREGRTELSGGWFDSVKQIQSWPRRRLMAETDLDVPLLYLCSDSSRGVTGPSFTITDGQSV